MTQTGNGGPSPSPTFGDRLSTAVAERESQIVLGIDPDPAKLWPAAIDRTSEARARLALTFSDAEEAAGEQPPRPGVVARLETAAAVLAHCRAMIDAVAPAVVAVKPQLACFERLGAPGWLALEHITSYAREQGLLVLADGKRGDVPVTAAAYGQALVASTPSPFGHVDGLGADAFTANPLLGRDSLEPLVQAAREHGAGVFVLVRTSNPGAADILDAQLATGERLWEHLARLVDELGQAGPAGLKDIGAVTGATEPEHLQRLRELMPHTPFLLPGIGAQGGDIASVAPAFAPGRAAGLVTASRSIANAHEATGATPSDAARAEAERLREQAWGLA
ncbi:orotidine-5'-phosphate decarboxylase [Solirubrobacter sp. CPCC 204708]|uniref:Orotidine 5'-phosphate decarboxylase n=1 Tax=Solirubrobacter deserti TaxID=2282478 RepID=A0ABT4RIR5_9ACTN|nr:orotidine-5'-phosphate decarboxylase [Solirubrobacter deserti]MBE2320207.1 orotidine-5'-phosphate decarboxylase [Solirubrobacter deserti]MDA0138407.1 orotidine-5'-phosphate decarboxylase [Solirubrobacter deserti]